MRLRTILAGAVALSWAGTSAAGRPTVEDVTVAQDPVTRKVTVTYALAGAPAIVTFDVLTNGAAVSPAHVRNYAGDVAHVVSPNAGRSFCWQPEPAWRGQTCGPGGLEIRVRAWATNSPPDYMVLNLRQQSAPPQWYTCGEALPDGGLTNDLYRTTRLVLRRIPAAGQSFTMGSHTNELTRETLNRADKEPPHRVSFTNDFYLGVFEVTQEQWRRVMGARWACTFSNETDWAVRPVERLKIENVRRGNWPTLERPKTDSTDNFISMLIRNTGLAGFELPTEAQWEFACRAGTDTMFNSGLDSEKQDRAPQLQPLGRFRYGGYYVDGVEGAEPTGDTPAARGGTARVGSYRSNAWGLYDMHGNVFEWCRDWYQVDPTAGVSEIEPTGPVSGEKDGDNNTHRLVRGGSCHSKSGECRSARRKRGNDVSATAGFRLCFLPER